MSNVRQARLHRDDGAAAVEFAIIGSLLLLIVCGIIEFGLVFIQSQALGNGARQGARLGVVANPSGSGTPTESCQAILNEVQSATQSLALNTNSISVQVDVKDGSTSTTRCPLTSSSASASTTTYPCSGTNPGAIMTVTANYSSSILVPLIFTGTTVNLTGQGVFQCEYQK